MTASLWWRVQRIVRNVTDLPASIAFYCDRLDFTLVEHATLSASQAALLGHGVEPVATATLRLGNELLALVQTGADTARYPRDRASNDLWFQHFAIRCPDMAAAVKRLCRADSPAAAHEPISQAPVRLPAASGGATAFKFRDPDGHPVELIQMGGNTPSPSGIDHSAISVANIEKSLAYYGALLGLTVHTRQVNSGGEQAALDALALPVVDVIGLDTGAGLSPHVELLGYRYPPGRPAKPPVRPADVAADILVGETSSMAAMLAVLQANAIPHKIAADGDAVLLCDPDGHWQLFIPGIQR